MPEKRMNGKELRLAKEARVEKYKKVGRVVGTAAGVLPFVGGTGVAGELAVNPLTVVTGPAGYKLGEKTGEGLAHLMNNIQFKNYYNR